MRRVKTAVIGAGFMGKVHAEAIRRLGYVDIVGVTAANAPDAAAFAQSIGVERSTGDYREFWPILPSKPSSCTPNSLHFPVTKAALEAGKHVLCEKPLSMSVAEAQEMVDWRWRKTCRTV